jgi:hypothetical protein
MVAVGRIFVNYRRADDPGVAGRLYDRLLGAFAPDQLFMDVEGGIAAGADFVDELRDQIAKCDVLLVVIGRQWLTLLDDLGHPRIEAPDDFVRIEIQAAIEQEKYIIPVLIGGAGMPAAEQLPDALRALTRRNAVRITHERFQADCKAFVDKLVSDLPEIVARRQARIEEELQKSVANDLQREAAEERERAMIALQEQLAISGDVIAKLRARVAQLEADLLAVNIRVAASPEELRRRVGIVNFKD